MPVFALLINLRFAFTGHIITQGWAEIRGKCKTKQEWHHNLGTAALARMGGTLDHTKQLLMKEIGMSIINLCTKYSN